MKTFICITIFLCFLFSCKKNDIKPEHLVDSTIKIYKNELPKKIIFYRDKNNRDIKNSKEYVFLDVKSLLKKNDENFMCLHIEYNKKGKSIGILSFKTGRIFSCTFDNEGKLLSKNIVQTKLEESKPYYIYYEILKRKYPDYMNWKLFPIPKDSLK
ncbi:hypothetical protein IW15_01425 [Chryseobacterium soli]|uniref:Lipoprotein n=1 Tax=Chryseobacterium soli TaxID=445961 RepID=A0A086ABR9_9FLAO|nr:hypothetical protein [Chryseobacterium soli]KFF14133.1 hypothetical protein IW15_01425 [Chryseobacterium soli]